MKARAVTQLDPDGALADNAARIVRVRLDELYSFVPAALDPAEREALHHMRIAAKRLRYVLELQDLIGEVHDCDVMLERVDAHLAELRRADADHLLSVVAEDGELALELAEHAPNQQSYRTLELVHVYYETRRRAAHQRFARRWAQLDESGLGRRLRTALDEARSRAVVAGGGSP
jgi:CHAD domain-containing protein